MKTRYIIKVVVAISIFGVLASCSKKGGVTPVTPVTPVIPVTPKVLTVSTFAGSGAQGSLDGTALTATFYSPSCVTFSSSGDLYIGDFANNLVRKISSTGSAVTTVAGTLTAGLTNGAALSARFFGTANIAFDKSGNIFLSDEGNNCIREISSAGTVTTLAGSLVKGFQDGTGTAALFSQPEGLVVDGSGNLYVVDGNNHSVRKIVITTGVVTTVAGTGIAGFNDGAGAAAQFHSPYGIAMDANGDLYVGDIVNNRIRKITVSTGVVSTFAGTGAIGSDNGTAATATFHFPCGVAFDSKGNLYTCQIRDFVIRKIATDGTVSTYAGNGTQGAADGAAASASFYQPIGITFDSSDNMYVADEYNNKIRKVALQ